MDSGDTSLLVEKIGIEIVEWAYKKAKFDALSSGIIATRVVDSLLILALGACDIYPVTINSKVKFVPGSAVSLSPATLFGVGVLEDFAIRYLGSLYERNRAVGLLYEHDSVVFTVNEDEMKFSVEDAIEMLKTESVKRGIDIDSIDFRRAVEVLKGMKYFDAVPSCKGGASVRVFDIAEAFKHIKNGREAVRTPVPEVAFGEKFSYLHTLAEAVDSGDITRDDSSKISFLLDTVKIQDIPLVGVEGCTYFENTDTASTVPPKKLSISEAKALCGYKTAVEERNVMPYEYVTSIGHMAATARFEVLRQVPKLVDAVSTIVGKVHARSKYREWDNIVSEEYALHTKSELSAKDLSILKNRIAGNCLHSNFLLDTADILDYERDKYMDYLQFMDRILKSQIKNLSNTLYVGAVLGNRREEFGKYLQLAREGLDIALKGKLVDVTLEKRKNYMHAILQSFVGDVSKELSVCLLKMFRAMSDDCAKSVPLGTIVYDGYHIWMKAAGFENQDNSLNDVAMIISEKAKMAAILMCLDKRKDRTWASWIERGKGLIGHQMIDKFSLNKGNSGISDVSQLVNWISDPLGEIAQKKRKEILPRASDIINQPSETFILKGCLNKALDYSGIEKDKLARLINLALSYCTIPANVDKLESEGLISRTTSYLSSTPGYIYFVLQEAIGIKSTLRKGVAGIKFPGFVGAIKVANTDLLKVTSSVFLNKGECEDAVFDKYWLPENPDVMLVHVRSASESPHTKQRIAESKIAAINQGMELRNVPSIVDAEVILQSDNSGL